MTVAHDVCIKLANASEGMADAVNGQGEGSPLRKKVALLLDEHDIRMKEGGRLLVVDSVFGVCINFVVNAPEEDFTYCDIVLEDARDILLPEINRLADGEVEMLLVRDAIIV